MEYLIIGIFVILIISLLLRLYLDQREIQDLEKQIIFLKKHATNLKLTVQKNPSKQWRNLVNNLNELIEQHRNLEITLQKTNENFKQTITNISHDLRTPLTSANGYIQMLNQQELEPEKREEYLKIIENRINVLKMMLDQLFEYARIEADELILEQEEVNLNALLAETISDYYQDFVQNHIKPKIQIPDENVYILGDKKALKRVFQNLIRNSLQHGEGDITITLDTNKTIVFQNHTNSIEMKDLEKIFERFYTTDTSRTKKTTGLGLTISKKLIQCMNGTIEADLKQDIFLIKIQF